MGKWKHLNMELRSWVIGHVLRLEQTSSSAIKSLLRMAKEKPKTLGNQSSALSFKSKVDLLYDLDEIDKEEYNHLLKLMEIRNQFAHNSDAVSFESLDDINPQINKYLEKNAPDNIDHEQNREKKLQQIFSELFKITVAKLMIIEFEYKKGIKDEIRKHVNDKIVENINEIWKSALEKRKENQQSTPLLILMSGDQDHIGQFEMDFKLSLSEFAQKELDKLEGKDILKELKPKAKFDD